MPTTLSIELFYTLGTGLLALLALIWRTLILRIRDIEEHQNSIPFHVLAEDVAVIKRDIEWIKNLFSAKK